MNTTGGAGEPNQEGWGEKDLPFLQQGGFALESVVAVWHKECYRFIRLLLAHIRIRREINAHGKFM